MTSRRGYFAELIVLVGRTAGAAAHLVQTLRQTLGLMHFKVQQYRLWIGRFTIDQLIAGRMSALCRPILNEPAGGNMRRGLADVCAYADAINRHGSKLSTAKKTKLAEVTISLLDCLRVLRSAIDPSEAGQRFLRVRKPAAIKLAMRFFTAGKSSEWHNPPERRSMRPVRASVFMSAPVTK